MRMKRKTQVERWLLELVNLPASGRYFGSASRDTTRVWELWAGAGITSSEEDLLQRHEEFTSLLADHRAILKNNFDIRFTSSIKRFPKLERVTIRSCADSFYYCCASISWIYHQYRIIDTNGNYWTPGDMASLQPTRLAVEPSPIAHGYLTSI